MVDVTSIHEMKLVATALFAIAILHTFGAKQILHLAHRFTPGSVAENLLHFLGEIEAIFGIWAGVLIVVWSVRFGSDSAVSYLESVQFTEPAFVFVIMCMSATRPVMQLARTLISLLKRLLPLPRHLADFVSLLVFGPLLGSLITEPAAMTVTALLLRDQYFTVHTPPKLRYATLGLLFVNVSIGGTLTHFAAPPVLMVASKWGWDTPFMLTHFGLAAIVAVTVSTLATAGFFRRELAELARTQKKTKATPAVPWWLVASHMFFLVLAIVNSHHMAVFIPLLLFFMGWCAVTKEYQDDLKVRESLMVAFFLGGLVTLGALQDWWIQPLMGQVSDLQLYFGTMALTAVTDNAALTYLGTLVPTLSDSARKLLVAGAVVGGGLTVIANAPNPAGYGILRPTFGDEGISPLGLFLGALPATIIAAIIFLI